MDHYLKFDLIWQLCKRSQDFVVVTAIDQGLNLTLRKEAFVASSDEFEG
jgi:hypothetical protein